MEFQDLPEGCVASILSRTTPVDAYRLSVVSKTFCSAAESDAVWERFLPSDYQSIAVWERFLPSDYQSIVSQSPWPLNYASKKALYLVLADRPLVIEDGKKSFQLEKKRGKKCYMLAVRALTIIWGSTERYWTWITLPDSRFPEVAQLKAVCWLEIRGAMSALALSPNTQYAVYLVYKMINSSGFDDHHVELSVGILGGHESTKKVCLEPKSRGNRVGRLQHVRSDQWLEIEMGEFFNAGLEDEVHMSVMGMMGGNWKRGLVIEGIEIRPKEKN